MTETPASGQVRDDLGAFRVGDDPIYLKEPTKGQLLFMYLTAAMDPEDSPADLIESMNGFIRVIRHLVVPAADAPQAEEGEPEPIGWTTLRNGVLDGSRDIEEILGLASGIVERWGDEAEVERNRAERRAAKAPVKKAVARPGRIRR